MTTRVLITNLGPVGALRPAHYISVGTQAPGGEGPVTHVASIAPGGYADFYVHAHQSLVIDEKES